MLQDPAYTDGGPVREGDRVHLAAWTMDGTVTGMTADQVHKKHAARRAVAVKLDGRGTVTCCACVLTLLSRAPTILPPEA